jgi:succinate-acetate transporter protein
MNSDSRHGSFYGGLAQVIAGILEFKKNNTFGMTALFPMVFSDIAVALIFREMGLDICNTGNALVAYLVMWGIFRYYLLAP